LARKGSAVPVALCAKGEFGPLEVRGADDRILPALTAAESAEIAFTSLVLASDRDGADIADAEEKLLVDVVLAPPRRARDAASQLEQRDAQWRDPHRRELLDLLVENLPLFVCFTPDTRRQSVSVDFVPQPLAFAGASRLAATRLSLRGRMSVVAPVSMWPPAEWTHIEVAAPSLAEFSSAEFSAMSADDEPRWLRTNGSRLHAAVRGTSQVLLLLRLVMAPRRALSLNLLALSLGTVVLLVATALTASSDSGGRVVTAALLLVPTILGSQLLTTFAVSADRLSAILLRVPVILITLGVLLGAAAIALGSNGRLLAIAAICSATVPIPSLLANVLRVTGARPPNDQAPVGGESNERPSSKERLEVSTR
jgi:hypothetical protein